MSPENYFKSLFDVERSAVKQDLIMFLDVSDLNILLSWSELNLTKRPNVIENTSLYGFIKRDSATVLFEAAKAKFRDHEWYHDDFKSKEKNYKTVRNDLVC